jgi:hypothetical protein
VIMESTQRHNTLSGASTVWAPIAQAAKARTWC